MRPGFKPDRLPDTYLLRQPARNEIFVFVLDAIHVFMGRMEPLRVLP
jgi:hypothetical protein